MVVGNGQMHFKTWALGDRIDISGELMVESFSQAAVGSAEDGGGAGWSKRWSCFPHGHKSFNCGRLCIQSQRL